MIDLHTVLQGHLEDFYQTCTQTAINEAHSVCEDDYHGNKDQFMSSFILPVCHLFQTLKKVKQMSLVLKLYIKYANYHPKSDASIYWIGYAIYYREIPHLPFLGSKNILLSYFSNFL